MVVCIHLPRFELSFAAGGAQALVGRALAAHDFRESALYDPDYRRRFREGSSKDVL